MPAPAVGPAVQMPRAVRFLIAVAGSSLGDVRPEVVTRRLQTVATSMAMAGIEWSVLTGGAPGAETVAADWAAAAGVEVRRLPPPPANDPWGELRRNQDMLGWMGKALEQGWAVRLEAFPSRLSSDVREMVKLCRANGYPTETTT